jgi:hypothetical protein
MKYYQYYIEAKESYKIIIEGGATMERSASSASTVSSYHFKTGDHH